jgi:uncharacterized repeat protein (TIGR03803 family)
LACAVASLVFGIGTLPSRAQTLDVLYSFPAGSNPSSPLVRDASGNLFGTTDGGDYHFGSVFKLAPDGTESTIYSFHGGADGSLPTGLMLGQDGNLYGTTLWGGEGGGFNGTVFKLTPEGIETVLYAFKGGTDGSQPMSGVVRDAEGNLYGTTYYGGSAQCGSCGVVFKIAPDGTETVLHTFTGPPNDGAWSIAGLALDSAGNLYGTTTYGGAYSWGTVFKLAPDSTETVLYSFSHGADGQNPSDTPLLDAHGNLYGTTAPMLFPTSTYGTVYKLVPATGALSTLHTFLNSSNGAYPYGPLTLDKNGNLFGTTLVSGSCQTDHGTVFEITAKGRLKTLQFFTRPVGDNPSQGVILDGQGNLYGTTSHGGASRSGTLFKLMP